MGLITYEGPPPFGLIGVQTGSADAVGDVVEMVLSVSLPDLSPVPIRIQIPLVASVAMALGNALRAAALRAEQNGLKG